jgi:hypothetical protein
MCVVTWTPWQVTPLRCDTVNTMFGGHYAGLMLWALAAVTVLGAVALTLAARRPTEGIDWTADQARRRVTARAIVATLTAPFCASLAAAAYGLAPAQQLASRFALNSPDIGWFPGAEVATFGSTYIQPNASFLVNSSVLLTACVTAGVTVAVLAAIVVLGDLATHARTARPAAPDSPKGVLDRTPEDDAGKQLDLGSKTMG